MTTWREPPWAKIYFGHAISTALLGMLLLSSKQTKDLHPYTQPILEWFPGAISISNLAPDPVSAQVFLTISMLIAAVMLVGAVWHIARGGYHTKTFETQKERWLTIVIGWIAEGLLIFCLWIIEYSTDGAKTRGFFYIKAAISSDLGIVTIMNFLMVGIPFFLILGSATMPFYTKARNQIKYF